jgi:hypothetical protein
LLSFDIWEKRCPPPHGMIIVGDGFCSRAPPPGAARQTETGDLLV